MFAHTHISRAILLLRWPEQRPCQSRLGRECRSDTRCRSLPSLNRTGEEDSSAQSHAINLNCATERGPGGGGGEELGGVRGRGVWGGGG